MLTDFLNVLPAAAVATKLFGWGSAVVGAGLGGGRFAAEGARRPLLGVPGADRMELTVGMLPVLFRVLLMGRAGRAMSGGPLEGRDGRGKVVVMASTLKKRRLYVKESYARGLYVDGRLQKCSNFR